MENNYFPNKWWSILRRLNIFLLSISCFSCFLQEIACSPCQTPLGVHHRPLNSNLTFEIVVSPDDGSSSPLQRKTGEKSEKAYIQAMGKSFATDALPDATEPGSIRASETVLLTGILFEGDEKGQNQMTSWSLGLSEDCHQYKEENYSLLKEKTDKVLNEKVKVTLHSMSFAKCIRLIPDQLKGKISSLRYELLGCEIGADSRLCKKELLPSSTPDIPGNKEISRTEDISSSYNNNELSRLEESSDIEQFNVTDFSNEDELLNENEPFDTNGIYSLFEPSNASSEDESLQMEILKNLTMNGNALREDGLFQEDTVPDNESETSHLKSDLLVNDDLAEVLEDLHFFQGNGTTENGNTSDILSAFKGECGFKPFFGKYLRNKRVVLGRKNVPREWPWLASLHYLPETIFTTKSGFKHLCAASLISPQWLVSAAHCFSNANLVGLENLTDWRVYLGVHDQALSEESDSVQKRNISLVIKHSRAGQGFEADIALIKLDRPVEFSESVRPICLDETEIFFEKATCYVSGWGQQSSGPDSTGTRFPYTAAISVLTLKECEEIYAKLPHDHSFKEYVRTEKDMVCAYGPGGEDTCQGDSGGGLMCTIDNTWHLVGITSGGFKCGCENFPAFYTRISFHMQWIRMNLEAYDRDIDVFRS